MFRGDFKENNRQIYPIDGKKNYQVNQLLINMIVIPFLF